MPDTLTRHVLIFGRVQGVSYRAWARDEARRLGVSGWVRNLRSGEVEALASGPAEAVEAFLARCREGPDWARVSEIRELGPAEPVAGPFRILETE